MKGQKTGIVNDHRMLLHKSKKKHPECPQRVEEIMKVMKENGYLQHPKVDFVESYDRQATNEEIGYVYPQKYIKYIQNLWPKASHRQDLTVLDTYFCESTEQAARISAGGVLLGLDQIMKGNWRNGYSIIRPPGHHSGYRNTINGFCIFNNVAIGARYLQHKYGLKKIAIIDWDIHHGDGTHSVFQQDPNVLFFSIHRYDHGIYYPAGDGHSMYNCGKGAGEGSKLNIPLNHIDEDYHNYPFQAPGDNQYVYIYHRIIEPIIKQFDPQFILISSGYDASRHDPLGGFSVTPNGYYYMAKRLADLGKPVLAVLEGGYNFKETALASLGVVKALLGEEKLPENVKNVNFENMYEKCQMNKIYHAHIDQIIDHHARYWKVLESQELRKYSTFVKSNEQKLFGVVKKDSEQSSSSSSEEQKEQQTMPQKKQETFHSSKEEQIQKRQPQGVQVTQGQNIPKQQSIKQTNETKATKETKAISNGSENSQSTTQFYFAAGHMQRFKNFSINKAQILKWAYSEQVKFYESAYPEKQFAPKYFGREGDYIAIQNLLYKQEEHIVVDFKLSRHSKKPDLTEQKAQKVKKKQELSTSQKYAIRVSGFTTPTYKETGLVIADETFMRKIITKVVTEDNQKMYCDFLTKMVETLRNVHRRYFNTSLLLIKGKHESRIGWIDFHYWYEDCQTFDTDLVEGIQNLIKFIKQVDTSKQCS